MHTSPADYLEGATQGGQIWVRVIGRGSFKLGPTLKAFVISAIQRGYRRLLVDLENCTALDSTFMGVLAGLALHLKPLNGSVQLLRLNAPNRDALTTLGLQILLAMPTADAPATPALQRLDPTPDLANSAASILAAHENLITAAPANRPRFNELVTQLKDEIQHPQ
jgi:anti-anti-sigma regulatory factor